VGGWGNSARVIELAGTRILVAWKGQTWLAMGADVGFSRASCGFVGASDGWQDLHDNCRLNWEFDEALDGNVAVVGQVQVPESRAFTIGIAFGHNQHAAATRLSQSLAIPFDTHRGRYVEQWRRPCCWTLALVEASRDEGRLYGISRNVLLAHEDKNFAGALIASASIPWGNAKGDEDLGGYHLVWTRDLVQSVTGLLAASDTATALRALVYLACTQHADGGFSQNFWIDGTPYWNGVQLDEVAFPVMLAWRLWRAEALQQFDPSAMVMAAARFLVTRGPVTEQERWEECGGYSPSTLAATIAGLVCAADFAISRGGDRTRSFLLDHADFLESHVERWTVTTEGTLVPAVARHYIRINPATPGAPTPTSEDEDPNGGVLVLANQLPGARYEYPAKEIVDAGFLELARYGIRRPGDPLIEDSLRVVDEVLKVETPFGPWRSGTCRAGAAAISRSGSHFGRCARWRPARCCVSRPTRPSCWNARPTPGGRSIERRRPQRAWASSTWTFPLPRINGRQLSSPSSGRRMTAAKDATTRWRWGRPADAEWPAGKTMALAHDTIAPVAVGCQRLSGGASPRRTSPSHAEIHLAIQNVEQQQ
jgi:glucoamylase